MPRRTKEQMAAARKRALAARIRNLKVRHRMTLAQYEDLKDYQGGVCPLCLRANGKTKNLAVEHDHELAAECDHPVNESCIDCWRGLCCSVCNKILGHARDDPEYFYRCIAYLTNPPAQRFFHESLSTGWPG